MSTSAILCPTCGTRIATITSSGNICPQPGHIVTRLLRQYSMMKCGACGSERKVRYPQKEAA